MAVSKRTRYEVLRRDGHTCRYCGRGAPEVPMTVDHVVPETLGGSHKPENLVAACKECNAGKSSVAPDAVLVGDVDQRAVELSRAMELAAQQAMADYDAMRVRVDRFDAKWCSWTAAGEPLPREGNWRNSISRFLAMGLSDAFILDAVDTALGNRRIRGGGAWSYFCGICWRELDQIRESALATATAAETGQSQARSAQARRPVDFDEFNLVDYWISGVAVALACDDDADLLDSALSDSMWNAMQAAWNAFHDDPDDGTASDREIVQAAIRESFIESMPRIQKLAQRAQTSPAWSLIAGFHEHYLDTVGERYGWDEDQLSRATWTMPTALRAAVDAVSEFHGRENVTEVEMFMAGCEAMDRAAAAELDVPASPDGVS